MDGPRDDRSLGQLFGDLSRQLGTLVRQEIDLAKTETTTRVTALGRDASMVGAGAALAYAALLVALIGLGFLLADLGLATWLAFIVVAAVAGIVAAVLVQQGRARLQHADLAPRKTIDTLKEDAAWARERVK